MMRSKSSFYILLGITIVAVAAAVVSRRPADEPSASYGFHLPGLGERLDMVRAVVVRTADSSLRLERTADGWVASTKSGYPADAGRIRELVLGMSRLQRLEKKTGNPDRLSALELRDIEDAGSRAVRITLLSGDEQELASILVGKTRDFQAGGRSRYFVRDAGNPQSWLVEGSLPPVLGDAVNWLEQRLLPDSGGSDLRSVTVTHPDGDRITIQRDAPDDADFQLTGLSDGGQINDQYSVNAIAQTLRGLSLKDVRTAPAEQSGESVATVDAVTFNGVRIGARVSGLDPDYGVTLTAEYQPEQDRSDDEAQEADGKNVARELNERWADRLFVVSRYSLDALTVQRSDLINAPESSGTD